MMVDRQGTSWDEKMASAYPQRVLDETNQEMFVWYMKMSPESKKEHMSSFEKIDGWVNGLLDSGYRIVKSSSITPKGYYNLQNYQTSRYEDLPPAADTLFFELPVISKDFMQMYDLLGRYYNNFPDYFKTSSDFRKYAQKSDIWILEDVKTNIPVAFSSYQMISENSPDAPEYKADYDFKKQMIYLDTIALDPSLQGKKIGGIFKQIMDSYYLNCFGMDTDYGLCTGEINTTERGTLSKNFHEKSGFYVHKTETVPYKKWHKRFKRIAAKANKSAAMGKPLSQMELSTRLSYLYGKQRA